MRINKFIGLATGKSRRNCDDLIAAGKITINDRTAKLGDRVQTSDKVCLDGEIISAAELITIMLNKPVGYVCSRDGQGSKTIYDLLDKKFHNLKPVGRLDKDSSGLLLLTNDGELAYQLTHPSFKKQKTYTIRLDRALSPGNEKAINKGIKLSDGISKMTLKKIETNRKTWEIKMHEGRNRQIRRTFKTLGLNVIELHRTHFGPYILTDLQPGQVSAAL